MPPSVRALAGAATPAWIHTLSKPGSGSAARIMPARTLGFAGRAHYSQARARFAMQWRCLALQGITTRVYDKATNSAHCKIGISCSVAARAAK